MKEKGKQFHLLLDEGAFQALSSMFEILKKEEEFVILNSSKLCSWIVVEFFKSYFVSSKSKIIQQHFNSKKYLKNLAHEINGNEDPQMVLEKALNQLKQSSKPEKKKNEKAVNSAISRAEHPQ